MLDKNEGIYTLGRFVVAPLLSVDLYATAYLRMKQEKVLDVLYYERDPGLPKFLGIMSTPGVTNIGCFVKHEDGRVDFVGLGHIGVPIVLPNGQKKAEISVAFFKDWQRRSVTFPLAQMMIEWTFDRADIDFLFGTTPERNPAMVKFLKALGFGHTAEPVPHFTCWQGELCGAVLSWLDAERWRLRSPFIPDSESLGTTVYGRKQFGREHAESDHSAAVGRREPVPPDGPEPTPAGTDAHCPPGSL